MAAALGLARATDSMAAQRRISEEAARGIRSGTREMQAQTRAYAAEAATGDPKKAQETAEELLRELAQIEESLERQQQARRQAGA